MTPHDRRLEGKTALITAAGQGIGRATATMFALQGATVWATDIDARALDGLDGCIPVRLDVRDARMVRRTIEDAGRLDILFNCAGIVPVGTILDCDPDQWALANDLNVTAMYHTIRAALPAMIDGGGGSIINMSSVASSIKGVANRFAYGATKAAVIGLTKAVAADHVAARVRCNAICPGTIDTPSLHQRLRDTGDYDAAWSAFVARQPLGRVGMADEIAALALYLASDESAFTTGQAHVIDGGWAI